MFCHLIAAGYAEINAAFANEGGDVACWEENEGQGKIFHERDIESSLTAELDVGAFEKGEGGLLEASFYSGDVCVRDVVPRGVNQNGEGLVME